MKHHQQTFVLEKKKKTIMLSCMDVFISCKQVHEIGSLIFSCFHFQGLGEEMSPAS